MTPTWLTGLLIAVLCHTWTSRKYNIICLSAFGGFGMCAVCCFALLRIVGDVFSFFFSSLYWISFYSPCHFLGNHLRGSNNDAKLNILHIFFFFHSCIASFPACGQIAINLNDFAWKIYSREWLVLMRFCAFSFFLAVEVVVAGCFFLILVRFSLVFYRIS